MFASVENRYVDPVAKRDERRSQPNLDRANDSAPSWDTSPLHDVPIGPDNAGDGVFAAANLIVAGWRIMRRRVSRLIDRVS